MSDDEGRLIADRYRLQARIGSGAMGVVWRALDERLDRTVAVKQVLLPPGLSQLEADNARQRALREGRIAARLQHPNAIAVYNVAEDDGKPILVMEYLPSRSLATVLNERGTLPPAEVARIGSQAASALVAAHAAGVTHRDIKPGNILLGDDGSVKITDFGISRAAGDITVTKTGLLAGTPAFLSPESARGEEPGPAADVFSLGATLYAAVEGRPPFGDNSNEIALLHTVATGRVTPSRQAGPLTGPLQAMLHSDPVARPPMPRAVELLQDVAAGRVAEPPTLPAVPRRPSTRVDLHAAAPPVGAAVGPAGEPSARTRSGKRAALAVLAVLAAAAVGILVAELLVSSGEPPAARAGGGTVSTTQPPPTSTRVTTTTPTPTPTPETASPAELRETVTRYYALLPRRTGRAWELLGPDLKAPGKDNYERFWDNIDSVKIVAGPTVVGQNMVDVGLEYEVDDRRVRETHRLGLLTEGGAPLVNSDQLLSSTQVDDGGDEKGDKKGDKKDKGDGKDDKKRDDDEGDDG